MGIGNSVATASYLASSGLSLATAIETDCGVNRTINQQRFLAFNRSRSDEPSSDIAAEGAAEAGAEELLVHLRAKQAADLLGRFREKQDEEEDDLLAPFTSELKLSSASLANPQPSQRRLTEVQTESDRVAACAKDITGFIRQMLLAASFAEHSATHCGGYSVQCAFWATRSASAFSGVAEGAARMVKPCTRAQDEGPESDVSATDCATESGGLVKFLGVAVGTAFDAAQECTNHTFGESMCGSSVGRIVAALGALTEMTSRANNVCRKESPLLNWQSCAVMIRFTGMSSNVLAKSITAAVLNCGLGQGPRSTEPMPVPRFFTSP